MPYNREKRSLMQTAAIEGFRGPDASQTGFAENWSASLAQTVNTGLSISKYIMDAPKRERRDKIQQMAREGEIDEDVLASFTSRIGGGRTPRPMIDYDGLADYLVEIGKAEVQTTEEINKQTRDFIHATEKDVAQLQSRAGIMGKVGNFAGAMHAGMALDPANAAATLAIPAAGPAATIWRTAAQQAKLGAYSNLAAEAIIQPMVMDYRNEMGLDYTFSDALTNASLSVILGGTVSGAAGALGHAFMNTRVASREAGKKGNLDDKEAFDEAAEIAKQMEMEFMNAPDPNITPQAHDKIVGRTGEGIDNGANRAVEAEPETPFDVNRSMVDEEDLTQMDLDLGPDPGAALRGAKSVERGTDPLSEQGLVQGAARVKELEGKLAIAITCIRN